MNQNNTAQKSNPTVLRQGRWILVTQAAAWKQTWRSWRMENKLVSY